ncbi:MAG: methyltransferase domain-containing protein [Dehalococcoidia bacterium]|nr:methyltransferase domain-containing protein [Dehalococcoidia bacterium]
MPESSGQPDLAEVGRGFSAKADEYDALAVTHPVVRWMRGRIRALVENELSPPGSILEINAGSGLDALYFAAKGYRVHATDIAPGMLAALAAKVASPEAGDRLSYEALSFAELGSVSGGPYDLVFSDLGGLNCTEDLERVASGLRSVLRPGGAIVWVIMPPVCPWELAQLLRGHRDTALRRLRRGGVIANVEGARVPVWYHSPGRVRRALGRDFRITRLRSFCLFCPPSFFHGFSQRHPGLTRTLMRLDDLIGGLPPFNRCGDFYALVACYDG